MKNYLSLIIFALTLLNSTLSLADPTKGLRISPLQIAALSLDGKLSLKIHPHLALTIPAIAQYYPIHKSFHDLGYFSTGVGVQLYLSSPVFESGWYAEPRASAGYARAAVEGLEAFSGPFIRFDILAGYQWAWSNGISLNLAAGAFYNHAFSQEAPVIGKILSGTGAGAIKILTNMQGLTSGFGPTFEFSLGYLW